MKSKRLGIYSGAFDPVHIGHITFALQAMRVANLDEIYFLPERRPRHKLGVEHFGHRVAMLRQAIKPHPKFHIIELTDISFSVEYTLPKLKTQFAGDQLVFLFGSDVIPTLGDWPKVDRLLKDAELVIGLRQHTDLKRIKQQIEQLPIQSSAVSIISSYAPTISSGKVRSALRRGTRAEGMLTSVERYSNQNWLYVSLPVE